MARLTSSKNGFDIGERLTDLFFDASLNECAYSGVDRNLTRCIEEVSNLNSLAV